MEANKSRGSSKTQFSKKGPLPLPLLLGLGLLVLFGGGFGLYALYQWRQGANPIPTSSATPSSTPAPVATDFVSEAAANAALISQGEKILLPASGPQKIEQKKAGAEAFAQTNWDEAIARYQQAVDTDPNDPESKIYLNNARARQAGTPLAMAVVVPIARSPDSAKEVLRGVALYQDQFNQSPTSPGQLLEVAIVNDGEASKAPALAEDLVNAPAILGVLGHGVDENSRQAVERYEQGNLTVLAPINTSVTTSASGQSVLQTISLSKKTSELLDNYLQKVSDTLANYALQNQAPAAATIFYNSDSPYSTQLQEKFAAALQQANGKLIDTVDIKSSTGFDAAAAIAAASDAGANIAFLALSKNKVDDAVALAQANAAELTPPLMLMGGDELYNPTLLVEGGRAIEGIVLAVPWRSQPKDPFAEQARDIWKGRISWRTATAYDATQALVSAFTQKRDRAGVADLLNQGIEISGTATEFDLFKETPLVKAVAGKDGPAGSKYQFDPLP